MGSYCSCSGSFKFNNEVILPKNSLNKKIIDSIPHYSNKEKQDKKSNKIKRYKTYNEAIQKSKKPEKKKIIVQERNSFISSSSCLQQHKIITNSKISSELIKELYSQYKPLDDNIAVEEVQLSIGDGAEYRGEWNKFKGERHGRGILIINKEKIYLGYWKNDKMNGLGKQIYHEINIDNINNFGIFKENKNYSYYIGEWKDNYQEGKGKESWPDGTYYEGEYKNGKKWGEGVLHLPDGSIYNGQFKDGEVCGKGKIIYADKREYDGEWANNKFNGKGVFIWPDGRKYTGEYSNNLKDGYGVFEWPNGKKYRGQWCKGKQNEEGEIYDPVKEKWTIGKWNMGKKVKCNV
jgi:hypothetical protein